MKKEIQNLFLLVLTLFALSFLLNQTDHFGVISYQKSKQCSKDEINNAYKEYIFSTPKFVR